MLNVFGGGVWIARRRRGKLDPMEPIRLRMLSGRNGSDTMRRTLIGLVTVALTACAHVGVQEMGSGQHSLTAVSSSGGYSGSHEEAVEQADAWCARSGQQTVIDGFYDKPSIGPNGEHSSSIIFSCAAPKSQPF